jgi:hypothetical protein
MAKPKIISTVNTGTDKNFEIKKSNNQDEPLVHIDQSKTLSTRTIIPCKRPVANKDVKRAIDRVKQAKKEEKNLSKKKSESKVEKKEESKETKEE